MVDGRIRAVTYKLNSSDNTVSAILPHFWTYTGIHSFPPPYPLLSLFALFPQLILCLRNGSKFQCSARRPKHRIMQQEEQKLTWDLKEVTSRLHHCSHRWCSFIGCIHGTCYPQVSEITSLSLSPLLSPLPIPIPILIPIPLSPSLSPHPSLPIPISPLSSPPPHPFSPLFSLHQKIFLFYFILFYLLILFCRLRLRSKIWRSSPRSRGVPLQTTNSQNGNSGGGGGGGGGGMGESGDMMMAHSSSGSSLMRM